MTADFGHDFTAPPCDYARGTHPVASSYTGLSYTAHLSRVVGTVGTLTTGPVLSITVTRGVTNKAAAAGSDGNSGTTLSKGAIVGVVRRRHLGGVRNSGTRVQGL